MTTLNDMITRIERELGEDNITEEIREAVHTAIEAYQTERYYFNEKRFEFPTVADRQDYTGEDHALIPCLLDIDWIMLVRSGVTYQLEYQGVDTIEYYTNNTSLGDPYWYTYFERSLRLYPIPSTSQWRVRIGAQYEVPAPQSDSETGNLWMTEAERLIRARAKWELAIHVIDTGDTQLAERMSAAIEEASSQLSKRTTRIKKGQNQVRPFSF